ncbi:hypothetical protein PR202_ga05443 [Eleusine coracana subsp. coracana]|uniref:WRKY domain-containing protein n=1 Tax=Eleusine coracana subsp. coracana TaxID=191504 RepID=A0AAV5BUB5_ELECO|nr:hypothetical protein PR202_ga04990 [Eleusine coracana subsp. coracana]GJM89270.1 hypothetical protein PR202_ga05443 [Eleusine coracana subsp. coracana]
MSPSPSRPPSNPRDAAIQELRRGTELAARLRQQVELIPELDRREGAVANVNEIAEAMESSLSILKSQSEHSSETGESMAVLAGCGTYSSDGGSSARNGAVARARKVRHRRGRLGEEARITKGILTEAPENDRFPWRKYGEKKILNAEYTRLYYKCGSSDNHSKCPAKKYVQRQSNNSNPPLFNVTFINEHTCCSTMFPDESSSRSDSSQVIDFTNPLLPSPLMEGAPGLKQEEEARTSVSMHSCVY